MTATAFAMAVRDTGVPRVVTEVPDSLFHTSGAEKLLTTTYVASDVIDVREARQIALLIAADAGAADNVPTMLLLGACAATAPLATDDSWYGLPAYDGVVTPNLPTSTKLSGADFSLTPEWGAVTVLPANLKLQATDNATDEIRLSVVIDVSWCTHFHLQAADVGGGATKASLLVQVVRVC
jgi:hypothetical protein